jgi:hypothetical protein
MVSDDDAFEVFSRFQSRRSMVEGRFAAIISNLGDSKPQIVARILVAELNAIFREFRSELPSKSQREMF